MHVEQHMRAVCVLVRGIRIRESSASPSARHVDCGHAVRSSWQGWGGDVKRSSKIWPAGELFLCAPASFVSQSFVHHRAAASIARAKPDHGNGRAPDNVLHPRGRARENAKESRSALHHTWQINDDGSKGRGSGCSSRRHNIIIKHPSVSCSDSSCNGALTQACHRLLHHAGIPWFRKHCGVVAASANAAADSNRCRRSECLRRAVLGDRADWRTPRGSWRS